MADSTGLYLWKSLIKDGCEWHGDVVSKRRTECLIVPPGVEPQTRLTLAGYTEGKDYMIDKDGCIWIA